MAGASRKRRGQSAQRGQGGEEDAAGGAGGFSHPVEALVDAVAEVDVGAARGRTEQDPGQGGA